MNNYILALLIKIHQKKLNDMISEGKPYDEILIQSKKLDKYIYYNLKNQIENTGKTQKIDFNKNMRVKFITKKYYKKFNSNMSKNEKSCERRRKNEYRRHKEK